MRIELWGSIGVYVFYRSIPVRARWVGLGTLALLALLLGPGTRYLGFVMGAVLFELGGRQYRTPQWLAFAALVSGVLLAFPAPGFVWRWHGGSLPVALRVGELSSISASVAAFLIVFALLNSQRLARPLSTPLPLFLGKISFPLYLVHVPMVCTVVATSVARLDLYEPWQLAWVFVVFFASAVAVAWVFETLIDAPLLRRLRASGHGAVAKRLEFT